MLNDEIEATHLTLTDVLEIMNDSFSQLMKEINEIRTLILSIYDIVNREND